MAKYYRVVFKEYDIKSSSETQDTIIIEGEVFVPSNFLDFGIGMINDAIFFL